MAKRRRGSKSIAIKEILVAHPAAKVAEIHTILAARRLKVSTALISKIKYAKPQSNGMAHANGTTLESLLAAKELVARVESFEAARSALDALAKLIEG
jgi:hypothetical protein